MGILNKTKVYTIGSMQYGDGTGWRNKLKEDFAPMKIHILDPYHKQFVRHISESRETRLELNKLREEGKWDELNKFWKDVRVHDLACVDKSDFVVWYLDVTIPTIGSVEEAAWSVRLKRPTYIVVHQGKEKAPDWIFGMVPHQYILSSLDEFVSEIKQIDAGTKKMDNRWRLFHEDIR